MKKMSIKQLLSGLAPAEEAGQESAESAKGGSSAAERLGAALLESLGAADDGVTDDELVDAILDAWSLSDRPGDEEPEDPDEYSDDEADEADDEELEDGVTPAESGGEEPFERTSRRPVPMKTGSIGSQAVDYSEMTTKQFNDLKRLLKKANADGRRIRL